MTVDFQRIGDVAELRPLEDEWRKLARAGGQGALFRSPEWLLPWWHAYHRALDAEPCVYVGRNDAGELVCLAPLYTRLARVGPGLKVREIRLWGDAGPRPPALDLLAAAGWEDRAGAALARILAEEPWDLVDLEPLADPSRMRASFAQRMSSAGFSVESKPAGGGARRIALGAAGISLDGQSDGLVSVYTDDGAQLRKGMSALRRLSRLEWADRDEHSPLADGESAQLLEELALTMGREGKARLARLDDSSGEAVAAALVVDDRERATVLAMAVDPEHALRRAPERLLLSEARAARERGCVALDVVTGAIEYALPPLPMSRQRVLALRVYNHGPQAAVARTYGAVRRSVDVAREAQGSAAAGARAAWAKIRTAAVHVASYERLHLYRGELWTRGIQPTSGLTLSLLPEEDFDALEDHARAAVLEGLELDEGYCRQKWRRGDLVVLASLGERPAGITWCARTPVEVPQLGRTLHLGHAEAYIHDVFVAPMARGRAVAPSMLEFLARELRQRDVYRGWALISSHNVASIRAFEKAAYTAVADIIHARMATVDKLIVRPPDPEAKQLLGLS